MGKGFETYIEPKTIRKFDGKKFTYDRSFKRKKDAQTRKKFLKERGMLVRVVRGSYRDRMGKSQLNYLVYVKRKR
jgi:hypothetical protein